MTEPTCAQAPAATLRVQFRVCGDREHRHGQGAGRRGYRRTRTAAIGYSGRRLLRPSFNRGHRFEEGAART